ncbi:MAG: glycine cleavage system aminomethyltransferase GcvT [Eubacteriales bacterium]|nr:glycine cleavage system aminomethyltransferase GcvT [Eubacteriales bacterium]
MDQKTPLYDCHEALGGKIVPFGGFLLPVQYPTGIIAEHMAVRQHAGLFDVSHMGEALLEGPDALDNLNRILTNRFDSLAVGGCRYAIMLYPDGGCVDDLIVYRMGEQKFFLVLNASNTEKDVAWLKEHLSGDVAFTNLSSQTAQIALQGPDAKEILSRYADESAFPTKYYSFVEHLTVAGVDCLCSRTGYTGEFGYELYMKPEQAGTVYKALIEGGAVPCGLGARDTLRLEAAMPLYGHEISETIDPLTAGLSFAVKLDKPFIGRDALVEKGEPAMARVGLHVVGRGIVREHMTLFSGEREVGFTTSGTMCPFVNCCCAMAYLPKELSEIGTKVEADVRGRRVPCEVVALPFYSKTKK